MIKEEILNRLSSLDINIDELNYILLDLVNEDKIQKYFISQGVDDNQIINVKSIMITSKLFFDYIISFKDIKKDYRNFRLEHLLLSNIKKIK